MIDVLNNDIKVYRDDLYPFLGGGNKGRKMDSIAEDVFLKEAKSIVTTGGVQSNHCRAVSVFAAQNNMECTLVLHGSSEEFYNQSGNAKIMRLSGSEIIFVENPKDIATAMDKAMLKYRSKNLKPYYIWGGGHTLKGGEAYVNVIKDLKKYCDQNNWRPKYIFLASGTGSTQAGLMAGLDKYEFLETTVIGISVGRKSMQAIKITDDFYNDLCSHLKIKKTPKKTIVLDEYLFGGYNMFTEKLRCFSENSIKNYGITLDTCYSGKAFYGMLDYINNNSINKNDILFWHTGGVFNFLAQ